jgi:hypothetical protein
VCHGRRDARLHAALSATGTNNARAAGGGISSIAIAGISVSDSTISGNTASATEPDDPVAVGGGVSLSISLGAFTNVTISGNRAITTGTSPTSQGGGIIAAGAALRRGDQQSVDPLLAPLADNGGPTLTHAPALAGPAVDEGSSASSGVHPAVTTDQRGATRPVDLASKANDPAGDGADIGAYEYGAYLGTVLAAAPKAYWRFGEGSGTVQKDSSGNGNNGTASLYDGGAHHHIVATVSGPGSTAKIYVDGADVTQTLPAGNVQVIEDTAFPLTFGIAGGMAANFDEFAVYDQVLTPAEALAHYNAGIGR